MKFNFSFSAPMAGLVIRSKEVEVLSMQGKSVVHHARAKIEGPETTRLVEAIQKALSAAGVTAKKLAVSIPSRDVLFRFFTIPNLPKGEWDTAVQFEARKYIPFKTESLVWDYQTVNPGGEGNRLEVVFAAIQRDTFLEIQQALTAAGIQPTTLEPRSLSLARLTQSAKSLSANEFVCVVDVEPETAHLAIVKNRMPYLTRDINLLSMVTELPVVDSSGGAPPLPAEFGTATAQDAAGPMPSQPASEATTDARAERLLSELSVSMDFFMREHPSTTISKVVLCGDEHTLGPWCAWLTERLRCPVELGLSLLTQRVQGSVPLAFASAVGLVQSLKDPASAMLNFLKRSVVKEAEAELSAPAVAASLKTPQAAIAMGVAASLLVASWLAANVAVSRERRQLEQARPLRPDVGWGLNQMEQPALQLVKDKASAHLALLKQAIGGRVSVAEKFDALARSLPEGIWLTGLEFRGEMDQTGKRQFQMVVSGACFLGGSDQELSSIQRFEQQMKSDPHFFSGFTVAQLGRINAKPGPKQYTYRTFQLNCDNKKVL